LFVEDTSQELKDIDHRVEEFDQRFEESGMTKKPDNRKKGKSKRPDSKQAGSANLRPSDSNEGFDLLPPSNDLEEAQTTSQSAIPGSSDSAAAPPVIPQVNEPLETADRRRQAAWKGFEEEEEDDDPALGFKMNHDPSSEEMDMTPMVDVTFLLLIFFMVTASFTIIRSVEQPRPTSDQPSMVVQEQEDQKDYVECIIDQHNTYRITVRTAEELEAPSNLEMQRIIRQAVEDYGPGRLVIRAHEESALKKVISVYSSARINGISQIEMSTTDRDY